MKRLIWRVLFPFCWLGNVVGFCSRAYRNKGHAAWRRDRFNPIIHYQYFGDSIAKMPERVILCGIGYIVSVSEGLVAFIEESPMWGCRSVIHFERDPYEKVQTLWRVSLQRSTAAPHVVAAYDWIKAVYGGSFEDKQKPIRSQTTEEGAKS